MDQTFFSISFVYEIIPSSLYVDLCAEIQLIDDKNCIVHHIRRIGTDESSLLPVMKLTLADNVWSHADGNKESNIARAIGGAINNYLKNKSKQYNKLEEG